MSEKFCQSCAMPLTDEVLGSNADQSKNQDYCSYCYQNGAFTADISMEEMIEFCVKPMAQANEGMTEQGARDAMHQFFPQLKRWRKQG